MQLLYTTQTKPGSYKTTSLQQSTNKARRYVTDKKSHYDHKNLLRPERKKKKK